MFPAILSAPRATPSNALQLGAPKFGFADLLSRNDRPDIVSAMGVSEIASWGTKRASIGAQDDTAVRGAIKRTNHTSEAHREPEDHAMSAAPLPEPVPTHEAGVCQLTTGLPGKPGEHPTPGKAEAEPADATTAAVRELSAAQCSRSETVSSPFTASSPGLHPNPASRARPDAAGAGIDPSARIDVVQGDAVRAFRARAGDSASSAQVSDTELRAPTMDGFSAAKNAAPGIVPSTPSSCAPAPHPLNPPKAESEAAASLPKASGPSRREIPAGPLTRVPNGDPSPSTVDCPEDERDRTTNAPHVEPLYGPTSSDSASSPTPASIDSPPRDQNPFPDIPTLEPPSESVNGGVKELSAAEPWSDPSGAISLLVPQVIGRPLFGAVVPATTKAPVRDAASPERAVGYELDLPLGMQDVQPDTGTNPLQQKPPTKIDLPVTEEQHPAHGTEANVPASVVPTMTQADAPMTHTSDERGPAAAPPHADSGGAPWNSVPAPKPATIDADAAELRLNVRTDSLGRVEIHAAVHDSRVTTSIAVEDGAARGAVASEFSQLSRGLNSHELRLETASVSIAGESNHGGLDFGGHGGRQFHRNSAQLLSSESRTAPEEENEDVGEGNLNIIV